MLKGKKSKLFPFKKEPFQNWAKTIPTELPPMIAPRNNLWQSSQSIKDYQLIGMVCALSGVVIIIHIIWEILGPQQVVTKYLTKAVGTIWSSVFTLNIWTSWPILPLFDRSKLLLNKDKPCKPRSDTAVTSDLVFCVFWSVGLNILGKYGSTRWLNMTILVNARTVLS